MRLTFLGSGDAFCDWRVNYNNNAVLETEDGLVLLDCGLTGLQSMRELSLCSHEVAGVLITHLHADHATLASLLLERFYGGPDGPVWLPTRVYSPPDVLVALRRVLSPYFDGVVGPRGGNAQDGLKGVFMGIPAHEVRIGGLRLRFFPVPHAPGRGDPKPAYGVEIEEQGRRAIWSSDTTFRPDWIAQTARQPEVKAFFHDCTFSPYYEGSVHTHFDQLQTLPDDVKARITLMHHVAVPLGVDVSAYAGAADRHDVYEL